MQRNRYEMFYIYSVVGKRRKSIVKSLLRMVTVVIGFASKISFDEVNLMRQKHIFARVLVSLSLCN